MKCFKRKLQAAQSALALFLIVLILGSPAGAETRSSDQRYIDHGDHTITDSKTGLMWLKEDSYIVTGHWLNWREAFKYVEALNEEAFGGHIDWRLPTLEELKTLYEKDKINSKQVGHEMVIHIDPIFGREGGGAQWSSVGNGNFNAFGVVFNTGNRFSAPKISRSRKTVRAVRK